MSFPVILQLLDRAGMQRAQQAVTRGHYLHKPVDVRSMPEGYAVTVSGVELGYLILGRPQASKCYPWYGSVDDVTLGTAECSRWSVLNLARVYFIENTRSTQQLLSPVFLPGFTDRKGIFRSTLGSTAIAQLADRVVLDYLLQRPPCFLDEPYGLKWLLSYCDTNLHRGALYRASGFELYRTNSDGIQTWRLPLRALTSIEDAQVRAASESSDRSREHRARREQLECI